MLTPDGSFNTAVGAQTLKSNTPAIAIMAWAASHSDSETTGLYNNAVGVNALRASTSGSSNNALGDEALIALTSGGNNVAVGDNAGHNLTTGSNNVYILAQGLASESNSCYIGSIFGQTSATGIPVLINSSNKLGTATSSKRFKEQIKPMGKTSEALYSLKPVSFRYKKELDPAATPQLGLVAEDVAKIDSALVVMDKEGKPYTVRYEQVNAMLLNEFLKEHRKVEDLEQKLETVVAQLKAQEAKIQKVSAQLEVTKPAPRTVASD